MLAGVVTKSCSRNRRRLAAVLLFILTGHTIAAPGSFKVNTLHLESGSSRDWVNTIYRDATGYLWVGTDNGLRRYDGYEYTVFSNDPANPGSIGSNLVWSLLIDSEQ